MCVCVGGGGGVSERYRKGSLRGYKRYQGGTWMYSVNLIPGIILQFFSTSLYSDVRTKEARKDL